MTSSPYLNRPLRSLEQALRDLARRRRAARRKAKPAEEVPEDEAAGDPASTSTEGDAP